MKKQPGHHPWNSLKNGAFSSHKSASHRNDDDGEQAIDSETSQNSEKLKTSRVFAGKNGKGGAKLEPLDQPIAVPNQVEEMPVSMSGFVPLTPNTSLDAIGKTNGLIIMQCIETLEILTGIETKNKYIVYDLYQRPMLYCAERSNFIMRECFGNERNFSMEIVDSQGVELMKCERKNPCCSFNDYLHTYFQGEKIGTMQKCCCSRKFQIYGTGCDSPILIKAPLCARNCGTKVFPVSTSDGARIGDIVRLYPGFLREFFTDADTFVVNFPPNLPINMKLLLISSVFLIDFTYFEEEE